VADIRMSNPGKPSVMHGWDTFWEGTQDGDSYASGGARHPAVMAFWNRSLPSLLASSKQPRVLDIATGSGAVVESLFEHAGDPPPEITCVDISRSAIDAVRERFPTVAGVVADARAIPLASSSYDIVTSQFGVEYAGPHALDEAARLLAPGGELAMLVHIRPGLIFEECSESLRAVRRMQKAKFIELARAFFQAGFAAVRGADRAPYDTAGLALNGAIGKVESVLDDMGEAVAGGTIARLYDDIARIHGRLQRYDPDEVLGWLQGISGEFEAYAQRMASMCESAMDTKTFRQRVRRLEQQGLEILEARQLRPARGRKAVAWQLRAGRPG
jgi:SAM-dependent methyltransferase